MSLPAPPTCATRAHVVNYHGNAHPDEYFWLREKTSDDVIRHLEAENGYADAILGAETQKLQEKLYDEFFSRIKEDDETAAIEKRGYLYYQRTQKGAQYPFYCRRRRIAGEELGEEEIMLDLNAMEDKFKFMHLGAVKVSPDGQFLAYSLDTKGDEIHQIFVKNLNTAEVISTPYEGYYSLEWANDNATLYFDTLDDIHRPYRIHRFNVHNPDTPSEVVYEEADKKFEVSLSKSASGRYLYVYVESFMATETWVVDAEDPRSQARLVQARERGVVYDVEHHGDAFLIRSDGDKCDNFRILQAPVATPGKEHWKELVAYDPKVFNEEVLPFKNHLVLLQRAQGMRRLRVYRIDGNSALDPGFQDITFDEAAYSLRVEEDQQLFDKGVLRFVFSSFAIPDTVIDYDLLTGTREIKKKKEVIGFDPTLYETQRHFAKSHDGEEIPISLVFKKGLQLNQQNPTLLYGYGSYGISVDSSFNNQRISFLDRGFVFAIAHIRGGGDNGRLWYKAGKFLDKQNTFLDFVSCAEKLIEAKFTGANHLAIEGRSAGGLLIGAVLNLRPELFKVAFMGVPFVDVVNTMMDETIPLTVNEYDEWGNPNDKEYFDAMLKYSPYDNLRAAGKMPHILIRAGLNDPRVQYWEPAKYMAKLRALKAAKATPEEEAGKGRFWFLKTDMGAGHFGVSGRYAYLKEVAYDYAFMIHYLLKI